MIEHLPMCHDLISWLDLINPIPLFNLISSILWYNLISPIFWSDLISLIPLFGLIALTWNVHSFTSPLKVDKDAPNHIPNNVIG